MKSFAPVMLIFALLFSTASHATQLYGEARDRSGRLVATAYITKHELNGDLLLNVEYQERTDGVVRPCVEPRTPVYVVFIVGERALSYPMHTICSPDFRDAYRSPGYARFWIRESMQKRDWNEIFPPRSDGTRWYALKLAFTNRANVFDPQAGWDSNFGENYPILLK